MLIAPDVLHIIIVTNGCSFRSRAALVSGLSDTAFSLTGGLFVVASNPHLAWRGPES